MGFTQIYHIGNFSLVFGEGFSMSNEKIATSSKANTTKEVGKMVRKASELKDLKELNLNARERAQIKHKRMDT